MKFSLAECIALMCCASALGIEISSSSPGGPAVNTVGNLGFCPKTICAGLNPLLLPNVFFALIHQDKATSGFKSGSDMIIFSIIESTTLWFLSLSPLAFGV